MRPSTSHRYLERIERVVDALLSAPADAHSVESLAAVANMSAYHFHRVFRGMVGETPLDHLTQWRMVRAANLLLANRPMKLAAIASAVGYESESSFGKVFSRVMGVSPGKYRSKIRTGWIRNDAATIFRE